VTTAAQQFKNYKLLDEVGAGGLGRVFKAIDQRSGRTVAVKVLHKKYQQSRKFLGIFHREVLTVSRLRHKHIVEFLDCNFDPPAYFIVTEFVDGWSLHELIRKISPMPPLIALCIAIDMLRGIDYLHLHDTVHSDLSSPNVLIDKAGRVLVTDFGLAFNTEVEDYKNYMVGTPGYYSPEHVSQAAIITKSDIYCVGLLLYEMITAHKAVPAVKSRSAVIAGMKAIDFDRIHTTERSMTKGLISILKGALKFSPSRRTKSAELMMFDIYKILKGHNIRFARLAIRQLLIDTKLAPPAEFTQQNIFAGFSRPETGWPRRTPPA
jgi:serine/threonine-protein kinase